MLLLSLVKDGTAIPSDGRRAVKEVSKVVDLDWIDNQACSLSQNIYVITIFYNERFFLNDKENPFYQLLF